MFLSDVLNHLGLTRGKQHNELQRTVVGTGFRLGVIRWLRANLAAVLFGAMWTTDRRRGDGSSQLGVCAQHGVRLTRSGWTQFTDAGRQFCTGVILQYVGFPLTGTLIHLGKNTLELCFIKQI